MQKVEIFEDRIKGWVLDPIQRMLEGDPNAGYAALAVMACYFEMISKYEDGYVGEGESKEHFKRGVTSIFGHQQPDVLRILYKCMRNGIYHGGFPSSQISIADQAIEALAFDAERHGVQLNPSLVLRSIQRHFDDYIGRLSGEDGSTLRNHFVTRFDTEQDRSV
jgi:hypothetical protein